MRRLSDRPYRHLCNLWRSLLTAVIWFGLLAPAGQLGASEAGAFFMGQYGPKAYGLNPQNWVTAQDSRGVLFFGNTEGIIEFDGATWRQISFGGFPALSLTFNEKGTLFVGSANDFGFLEPDKEGDFHFVSLARQLPTSARQFGNVRSIACLDDHVWFTAVDKVFAWDTKARKLEKITAAGAIRSFVFDHQVYVSFRPYGLKRLSGTKLSTVSEMEAIPHSQLRSMVRFQHEPIFATAEDLYRIDRGRVAKWNNKASAVLRDALITSVLPLRNGLLAVGTTRQGLYLFDARGRLEAVVDKRSGLRSDAISSLYEDRQNGLWLTLDRGLARVEVESPLTSYGESENMGEMVTAITRFNGTIYAGTALGLSYLLPGLNGALPTFQAMPGVQDHVVALLSLKEELLTGGAGGIFRVSRGNAEQVLKATVIYDLAASSDHNRVYAVGSGGLYVLKRTGGRWQLDSHLEGPEWRSVVEDSSRNVWVTGRTSITHVDLSHESPLSETFGRTEGVPTGLVNAYRVAGRVLFTTSQGIRSFDSQKRVFVPDAVLGNEFADNSVRASLVRSGPNGEIWISGNGYHSVLSRKPDGTYTRRGDPLHRAGIEEIYGLYLEENGTAWASGTDGGLVRFKPQSVQPEVVPMLLLRRIRSLKSKEVIFDGTATATKPRIRYADNALRFEFALPDFTDPTRTEYQVLLKGLDRDWSAWSIEPEKEYTNLYEKDYVLYARARNVAGATSAPVEFHFRVLPPWYRTWWSFILYALLLLFVIAFVIRLRLRQLAGQNRKLEMMVTARTARIREQRDEIVEKERETTSLLLNILPPKIAEELRTTGKVEPIACKHVSVCFTDFVGFTRACERMTAQELVTALHTYFGAFDEVITRYHLEKLKTIGDAYMFVGGLPQSKKAATLDTVLAALELLRTVERLGEVPGNVNWSVRIGVHTGPAVAGIVGSQKFAFDIWGETVNLASRLETSAQADTVNVSSEAYELIKDFIECEPRGLVKTKEGRYLEMYFARQIRPELVADPDLFYQLYRERFQESAPPINLEAHSPGAAAKLS